VEVQTTVDNVACDHRLRVLLPTGANTSTCLADSPFDVVQRPVALLADNHLYRELEVETRPQQTWTAAFDQQRGLAVVAEGLHEAAVRDLPERPLALTLFRSTQRTVFTAGQPEGQLQGRMTFRYWIVPLPGRCDVPRLCHLGQLINAGLRDVQLQSLDVALHRQAKALPPTAGLVQVDGPAVVTSFRQVAGAKELRMFNPTEGAADVRLCFHGWPGNAPTMAQPVDLESHPIGAAIGAKEGVIPLRLTAKQILTVRLT
jgi:alpha-mannosidase/mannosylglycerate hydrolase